jgi:hypothetical protein
MKKLRPFEASLKIYQSTRRNVPEHENFYQSPKLNNPDYFNLLQYWVFKFRNGTEILEVGKTNADGLLQVLQII